MTAQLLHGDCHQLLTTLPPDSVDLVLTDPPYGIMNCHGKTGWYAEKLRWDERLDQTTIWAELNRVVRPKGMILLFSKEPLTSQLIQSPHPNLPFSYRLIWVKNHFGHPLSCRRMPVNLFEDICVFYKQFDSNKRDPRRDYVAKLLEFIGKPPKAIIAEHGRQFEHFLKHQNLQFSLCTEAAWQQLTECFSLRDFPDWKSYKQLQAWQPFKRTFNLPEGKKFKSNLFSYPKDVPSVHPTQKPVALLTDLTDTFSHPGDTVLDFTMGSGSTGVACVKTGRHFVGIEANKAYFAMAEKRIRQAQSIRTTDEEIKPAA
ncbi:DNA-methyltransferase [Arsenophonus sp.]|uniref:DNA-methyltransferase n=1 Tax=Arsenophonus sp. TaxID=1872640 RepID=UPI003879E996